MPLSCNLAYSCGLFSKHYFECMPFIWVLWFIHVQHFSIFSKLDKESLIIRVGEHDTYLPPELEQAPHQDGYVADIYIPNNYRADTAFNDLALIKMKEPFKFRENIVPICSPIISPEYGNSDIYDPHRCLATGWGKDAYSKTISNIRLFEARSAKPLY